MYSSSSIICALDAIFCISDDNLVYICYGISNNDNDINVPSLVKGLCDIKTIDCGNDHILCLDFNGSVFSFGDNYYGQLGLGQDYNELKGTLIPQKIDIPSCKQVACGSSFSMCLAENNLLYSFGKNSNRELGLDINDNNNYSSPQLIRNFDNVEHIVCGHDHSICKTYDNIYYGWGSNYYGQLGHAENKDYNKPTLCNNYPDDIIFIKCGCLYTLLLTLEGRVYSLGYNLYGQLGFRYGDIDQTNTPTLIPNIPEIKRIECGAKHSMCIDINNDLWVFGYNSHGQLGLRDTESRNKPTKHLTLSNIMDISSRGYNTFIKTFDNKIYAFGYTGCLQLGINASRQLTPIQIFQDNENIWGSFIGKSKQKSARK